MFNYSFWADEGYISGIASQWILGKMPLFSALNAPGILYQKVQMFTIALFFKLFGISEMSARLPSLIVFFFGIILIFILAKKLSNFYGALLSAFIYGFSHLNLAYATQAKPYAIIETILLMILYLLTDKKIRHLEIILLCILATFLHSIGILLWILYFAFLVSTFQRYKVLKLKLSNFLPFLIFVIVAIPTIILFINSGPFFQYNNLYQVTKLFIYKYSFISVSAFFGFFWLFKKYQKISLAILAYSLIIFLMTTFEVYIFNIRYVLSVFGIIFLYFGIFWAKVGEKYLPKKPWLIPIAVMILLYATGYKIVRLPQAYYNPNIDKYGDVQIANYKDFYGELKRRFSDYKNLYVVNDTFDVEDWYFGRYSNAYFMKFTTKPYKHHTADAMVYGSLDDFKKIMKNHPQGLLIMEDWQSFLPDDIKQYAKKNLKLEFRVESLKEAPNDPWPLALFSWEMP